MKNKNIKKKILIISDVENPGHADSKCMVVRGINEYSAYSERLTAGIIAAYNTVKECGYDAVIKEMHNNYRNIILEDLPSEATKCLARKWKGNIYRYLQMMIDEDFTAAVIIGVHCGGLKIGYKNNDLRKPSTVYAVINGRYVNEFMLNVYWLSYLGIPVIMVSGNEYECQNAAIQIPDITTVPTSYGMGNDIVCDDNEIIKEKISKGIQEALRKNVYDCYTELPARIDMEVYYSNPYDVISAMSMRNVRMKNMNTAELVTCDFVDVINFNSYHM